MDVLKYARMAAAYVFIATVVVSWANLRTSDSNDIPRPEYKLTYYCACVKCCGKWSDGYFANGSKTASCTTPTIACNWLPFGSLVKIDGVIYTVRDRGAKKYFGTVDTPILAFDIFCRSHVEARNKGVRYTKNVEVMK